MQIDCGLALMFIVGDALTVMETVAVFVHPFRLVPVTV
jgi:hypothetical protein